MSKSVLVTVPTEPYPTRLFDLTHNAMEAGTVTNFSVRLYSSLENVSDDVRKMLVEILPGQLWALAIPNFEPQQTAASVGDKQ